jgi:glyoxylase-like metal-dependent hydrolase (beta-lactamase superfamily II)
MKIHNLRVGPIDTNCYIVEDESSKKALIIDPGEEAEKILSFINKLQLIPLYIVITHGHFDHIGANKKLKETLKIPILMHAGDLFGLSMSDSPPPDRLINDKNHFEVGSLKFEVVHCPGHTPGGISLYCEKDKTIFTGDTLFSGTWGRTDLPHSSEKDMAASLKKLLALPPETKVYPGHGRPTTIGNEQGLLSEI